MTQGTLPFKYESEKQGLGLTASAGPPVCLGMAEAMGLAKSMDGLWAFPVRVAVDLGIGGPLRNPWRCGSLNQKALMADESSLGGIITRTIAGSRTAL